MISNQHIWIEDDLWQLGKLWSDVHTVEEVATMYEEVLSHWEANKRHFDAQEARLRARLAELRRMEERAA